MRSGYSETEVNATSEGGRNDGHDTGTGIKSHLGTSFNTRNAKRIREKDLGLRTVKADDVGALQRDPLIRNAAKDIGAEGSERREGDRLDII